jgi:hypothetical protein
MLLISVLAWSCNLVDSLHNLDADLVPVGTLQDDEVNEEE